jgi:WD40 repeat protein
MKAQKRRISIVAMALAVLIPACTENREAVEAELSARDKQAIERFTEDVSSIIYCIAFSPDGKTLFGGTGFYNAKVWSWDVETGKFLREAEVQEKVVHSRDDNWSIVRSIAPSVGSSLIGVGGEFSQRKAFITWDGASRTADDVPGLPVPLCLVAGVRPGTFFCGSASGEVNRVDVESCQVATIGKMAAAIGWIVYEPQRNLLFTGSKFESAVWHLESGKRIGSFQWVEFTSGNFSLTNEGLRLIGKDKHGDLLVNQFDGDEFQIESRRKLTESISCVNLSHDGKFVAAILPANGRIDGGPMSASDDTGDGSTGYGTLRVWNTDSWSEVAIQFNDADLGPILFSPIAPVMAVLHKAGTPTIIDILTGQARRLDSVPRPPNAETDEAP